MKAGINPPSKASDNDSYQLECQFALEPSLAGLLRKATEAGWDEAHILVAILSFASERITALEGGIVDDVSDGTH